jgi:hypothetical protein
MAKRSKQSTSSGGTAAVSTTWRTVASFLIFVHLFVVAAAILGNATGAPIWERIVNGVPGLRPYAQALDMNHSYLYHLSWNQSIDADHSIEVDVTNPTTQQVQTEQFPNNQTWLGIRRRRYRLLGYQLAYDSEQAAVDEITSTEESLIPQAVGGFVMRQVGSDTARLRCVVHLPLTPGEVAGREVAGGDGTPLDPFDATTYQNVYEAHLRRDTSGVTVLKLPTNQRSAPGVR